MIEEATKLENFLPRSYRTKTESDYIRFLWDAFGTNVEHGKYQFAFLAYHMLLMSFVYFNIWQIRLIRRHDFDLALVGFTKDTEDALQNASSPFVFSAVNERTVMRFLKLIRCDHGMIKAYGKLVEDRNKTAHANGHIFCSTEDALILKVRDVLRKVEEIQRHSAPTISKGYNAFLIESQDPGDRQCIDDSEQIEEMLVRKFYMSASDIAFCRNYDIRGLAGEAGFAAVQKLHQRLVDLYPSEEETV